MNGNSLLCFIYGMVVFITVFSGSFICLFIAVLLVVFMMLLTGGYCHKIKIPLSSLYVLMMLSGLFFCYEVIGSDYSFGPNKGLMYITAVVYMVILLVITAFLAFCPKTISNVFLISIQLFIFFWSMNNFLFHPDVTLARQFMFYSLGSGHVMINSPGIINLSLISILAYALQSNKPFMVVIGFLACGMSSILLMNRTGIIGNFIALVFYIILSGGFRWHKVLSVVLLCTIFIYCLAQLDSFSTVWELSLNRISDEGLESNRWGHFEAAFSYIINGDNILGGAHPDTQFEVTYWFHNLAFDSYSRAGIFGLIMSVMSVISILFIAYLKSKYAIMAVLLMMVTWLTGVPFSGLYYAEIFIPFAVAIRTLVDLHEENKSNDL